MPPNLLFIHSSGQQSHNQGSGALLQHLKQGLGSDYQVLAPKMPDPVNPKYGQWQTRLHELLASLNGFIVLAGHSLGGSVLLKYCLENNINQPIAGIFIISAPFWSQDEDWQAPQFMLPAGEVGAIAPIFFYHSKDDDVVPFAHLGVYARTFSQVTVRALQGCGHYYKSGADAIVDDLKTLLSHYPPQ